jgi:hypothetical protein
MRVLLGTVAAALVVALLAGMLLTRMHGISGQTNGGHGNVFPAQGTCVPGDITAHVPENGSIDSLDMVSPDEGWAIGEVMDPATAEPGTSFILHYQNCTWTLMATSLRDAGLSSISMGSATDGWALGSTTGGAPFAMQYANGVWKPVTPPGADVLHGGTYAGVHMLSADEGWVTFNRVKDGQGYLTQGLLHLANGRWTTVDTPFPGIENVLPVAPNEAWVEGDTTATQQIPDFYHYRAGTWTRMAPQSGIRAYTMRMVSPNDIWASGQSDPGSGNAIGAVLHYDGSRWQRVSVDASGHPRDVEAFGQGESWAFAKDEQTIINGNTVPPTEMVISGAQYQHNGSWQHVAWPFPAIALVGSLTRVSTEEYWAIGYYERSYQTPTGNGGYSGAGYAVGVLLYFAHGSWHEIPTN